MAGQAYYLDANAVIAMLERSTPLTAPQSAFLRGLENGTVEVWSSLVAMMECLVHPIRTGEPGRIDIIRSFFEGGAVPLVPVDSTLIWHAAELRARDGLSLPDALHVASAIVAGCTTFLSADRRLRVPDGMRRLSFEEIGAG